MFDFATSCSYCGVSITGEAGRAGESVRCKCGATVLVPMSEPPATLLKPARRDRRAVAISVIVVLFTLTAGEFYRFLRNPTGAAVPPIRRPSQGSRSSSGAKSAADWVKSLRTHERAARDALHKLGTEALPALTDGLKHDDATVRMVSAELLGDLGPDARAAVPSLGELAQRPGNLADTGASAAIAALGKIGPDAKGAASALLAVWNTTNLDELVWRGTAGVSLVKIGTLSADAVVRDLEADLLTSNDRVRLSAIIGLRELGPLAITAVPALVDSLIATRKPSDSLLLINAAMALDAIDPDRSHSTWQQLRKARGGELIDPKAVAAAATRVNQQMHTKPR